MQKEPSQYRSPTIWFSSLPFNLMRAKTIARIKALKARAKRWRRSFPWLVLGLHGLGCKTCKAAGINSVWANGEGGLALLLN